MRAMKHIIILDVLDHTPGQWHGGVQAVGHDAEAMMQRPGAGIS